MSTIHLKGPGLNAYFAAQMVAEYGPEEALEKSVGPMRGAVERVIAKRKAATLAAFDDLAHNEKRERDEVKASVERESRNRL